MALRMRGMEPAEVLDMRTIARDMQAKLQAAKAASAK